MGPGRPFQNITTQRSAWKVKLGRMCYPYLTYIVCLQQRKKKVDQLFAGGQRTAGPLSLLSGDGARLGGGQRQERHLHLSLRPQDETGRYRYVQVPQSISDVNPLFLAAECPRRQPHVTRIPRAHGRFLACVCAAELCEHR